MGTQLGRHLFSAREKKKKERKDLNILVCRACGVVTCGRSAIDETYAFVQWFEPVFGQRKDYACFSTFSRIGLYVNTFMNEYI